MARDSSGTYTAPTNSWNPAVEGSVIDETDWNSILTDIETALTDSLSVSGKGKVSAHIDFDENGSPGTPASNVGRMYAGDDSGLTTVYWKDSAGNVYNLLQGAASGLTYQFDTSTTTSSDPGAGKVRFNNATISSVTEIAIDDSTAAGADVSAFVLTWDDSSSSPRGTVYVQKRTAPATIAIFNVTGNSTDETGWTRLSVTYVTHNGSFSANDPISVAFATAGTGSTGPAGAAGTNGTDPGIRWAFDSSTTTNTDPGTGDLRLNNATLSSVTEIAISYSSGETSNPSVENFVKAWDDSSTSANRGTLIIKKASAPQNFAIYSITSAITDGTTYGRFTLSHIVSNGSFSNTDVLAVQFFRTGDQGASGSGTGDVVGPASSVDNEIALFDSTTGKLLKRASTTGVLKASSGVIAAAVAGTDIVVPGGALGTPSSGTLTNCTGLPVATGISGLGTGVATALAVNVGSAGAPVVNGGALGTPSSGTLTNATGLPISTGVSGLGSGVATFLATPSVANLNSAVTGGPVRAAGKETIFVPSGAMISRTTNGAASGTVELATNDIMLRVLDFDTTTEEGVGFWVAMPKSWNESTVTFQALWTAASGSGGVAWGLAAYSFSDDDAMDTAVSGQQIVTDTLITANDMHITAESSAITIGGTPAEGDAVYFELTREVANGSDTLGVDARLIGIRLFFTTNAANDT